MLYLSKPKKFNPKFVVASCFVEYTGKILLLLRQDHKSEGNTWGVPAGKVDSREKPHQAISREIREETGLEIFDNQISYFSKVFVHYPNYDFIYHIFHAQLTDQNKVQINPLEHKNYKWISPQNALKIPLVPDLDACIKLFYKIQLKK